MKMHQDIRGWLWMTGVANVQRKKKTNAIFEWSRCSEEKRRQKNKEENWKFEAIWRGCNLLKECCRRNDWTTESRAHDKFPGPCENDEFRTSRQNKACVTCSIHLWWYFLLAILEKEIGSVIRRRSLRIYHDNIIAYFHIQNSRLGVLSNGRIR